jgi:F-type H+-transporting ATPase subunit delta
MPNPRLATRYAKSLIGLAQEKGQLEEVNKDMEFLQTCIKVSKEFRVVLGSPIIKAETKVAILAAVTKDKIGALTNGFCQLLLTKSRENVLPEIVTAFKDQYNEIKGISRIKFSTAQPISEELRIAIGNKITADTGIQNIELESKVDESLIGGFVLEYNNNLIDASIARDLRDIKKQFLKNDFVMKIR